MSSRTLFLAELALLGVILIWGLNFGVMKVAVSRMDPLVFNATRFSLSVAFLGALHWRDARRRGRSFLPPASLGAVVLALGLFGHVGYQMGFALGLERTTSGTASLLIASSPLWTGLVGHVARFEILGLRSWVGLVVAFVGTAIVASATGVELGRDVLVGNLFCIGAAACWGVYTAWNRPHLEHHSPLALAFWTMAVSAPVLWLVALPGLAGMEASVWDAPMIGAALYAGFLGTGVAYVLWNVGVRHVGPARTSAVTCLVPLVALLVGASFLDEPIEPLQIVGGAIVLVGIVTMGRARADEEDGSSPSDVPEPPPVD